VVSGFDRIKRGVQNLLKMNLQNCFIKEKGKSFIFSLFLGFGPLAQPAHHPLAFRRPMWALPSFPSARPKLAARPSSWASPQAKPQRAHPPALAK
jgi:hypothetical protein